MLKLRENKGLTLMEVIAALAILGILCIGLLPVLTNGFKGVFAAGNNNKDLFISQDEIENAIADGATVNTGQLSIEFPDTTPITVNVNGEYITKDSLKVFTPESD